MRRWAAYLLGIAVSCAVGLPDMAQQPGKIFRIGILSPAASPSTKAFDSLRKGLRELGYIEGPNITIEYRLAAGDYGQWPGMAADLVRLPVDLIVTDSGIATQIARQATRAIPIVAATAGPLPTAASNPAEISSGAATAMGRSCRPRMRAASSVALRDNTVVAGFHNAPTHETAGRTSLSNSSRLPPSSYPVKPVTFPPGCARLTARPVATGSARQPKDCSSARHHIPQCGKEEDAILVREKDQRFESLAPAAESANFWFLSSGTPSCCTRSSSHTVAACCGCTNIPRTAGGAQEAGPFYRSAVEANGHFGTPSGHGNGLRTWIQTGGRTIAREADP